MQSVDGGVNLFQVEGSDATAVCMPTHHITAKGGGRQLSYPPYATEQPRGQPPHRQHGEATADESGQGERAGPSKYLDEHVCDAAFMYCNVFHDEIARTTPTR